MSLETLKDVKEIGGFKVMTNEDRPIKGDGSVDWDKFDELRKFVPICIDHPKNMISFKIQNGPIKENGVNGCQVDTLIETAKLMIEGLDAKVPCWENTMALTKLEEALMWLKKRTEERKRRGVEGTNRD